MTLDTCAALLFDLEPGDVTVIVWKGNTSPLAIRRSWDAVSSKIGPLLLLKICGWLEIAMISACRVIAKKGS